MAVLMPRFRDWLVDGYYLSEYLPKLNHLEFQIECLKYGDRDITHLEEKEQLSQQWNEREEYVIKAAAQIGEMQQRGIPVDLFNRALQEFQDWLLARKSESRRIAGKKGAEQKAANGTSRSRTGRWRKD
jgi:hypothetical protein